LNPLEPPDFWNFRKNPLVPEKKKSEKKNPKKNPKKSEKKS
jgi:hypothetical protein